MTRLSRRTGIKLATYRRPRLGASVRFLVSAPVSFVTCNLIGRRRVRRVTRSRTQSVTNVLTERLDQSRPNCNSLSLSFSFVLAVRLYAKRLGRIKRIYIYMYISKCMRLMLEIEIFIKIILIGKNEKGRKCIRLILLWRIKFLWT